MIPKETVDLIIDTAQIVEVIGDFVTLKRRGANYTACCPFHNEKTPSFAVSPAKGIYKCFGCGKAGSAVNFVMEHESLSYVEALKFLAKRYNIEVVEKEETAEDIARKTRKESLLLVSEFAAKHFIKNLETPEGKSLAKTYFKHRGLSEEITEKYGLGWATTSHSALINAAKEAGYKEEFLIDTGLAYKKDNGNIVDRFFDRVIFPIHSANGRIIAFGARTLKTDKTIAKYLNSPETDIYIKSRSLYGIYFAKNEINKQNKCYLVEGYLDVLSMHQLGLTNTVASSGTSLTADQVRLIKKYTDNISIIYDGDSAGIKAAIRGIDIILEEGMNVKIVLLPDGHDPDSFAKSHSLDEVNNFLKENEKDFIEFKSDILLADAGNDPIKKAELINTIADSISLISDPVKRSVYVELCSNKFNISSDILFERVSKTRGTALISQKERLIREEKKKEVKNNADISHINTPNLSISNPYLAPIEKDLLAFILVSGQDELMFNEDSEFYDEDSSKISVAEFISISLEEDELFFQNEIYKKVYDLYFELEKQGLDNNKICQRMLNNDDSEIAELAADILIDKYRLTIKKLESSLTARETILVQFVPNTIIAYQIKRVELMLQEKNTELINNPDQLEQILSEVTQLNKIKTALNNKLGRV